MSDMIGRQFELWQSEFVKEAYTDQMGKTHPAQVVRRRVIVAITRTLDLVGGWSGELHKDGVWIATDSAGTEYQNSFDETSMGGRNSWWDGKSSWIMATKRGWFDPYINPDKTLAVPVELPQYAPANPLNYQI